MEENKKKDNGIFNATILKLTVAAIKSLEGLKLMIEKDPSIDLYSKKSNLDGMQGWFIQAVCTASRSNAEKEKAAEEAK